MLKLLVVDDENAVGTALIDCLQTLGHQAHLSDSAESALTVLETSTPDVVLTDLRMGGMNGVELVAKLKQLHPHVTPVVMTAQGSIDTAVSAIRNGAYDYLEKPFSLEQLEHLMLKIEKYRSLRNENDKLKNQIDLLTGPDQVMSKNAKMKKIIDTAKKCAMTNSTILITGESGTGKTYLAKIIHENSPRSDGPFAVVNCATLSENLLESELFGHARGSFTGAVKDKVGRLQIAHTGTVFLDEIGEISPGLQTKLLRFLQEREFERVGDTKTIHVDVRIIAATNKDLEKEVKAGHFREDLYFRLNVIELQMPSLRQRTEDLPELIDGLLGQSFAAIKKEIKPLSSQAKMALLNYPWPGNIRELKNALERAAILASSNEITLDDLPDRVQEASVLGLSPQAFSAATGPTPQAVAAGAPNPAGLSLEDLERQYIQHTLATTQTLEEAATILGINLSTLWRKRKLYGME